MRGQLETLLLLDVLNHLVEVVLTHLVHARINLDDIALVTLFLHRHLHDVCRLLLDPLVLIIVFVNSLFAELGLFLLQSTSRVPGALSAWTPLFVVLKLSLALSFKVGLFCPGVRVH